MDTVFIKIISFPSTPGLNDKISFCFPLCRRIEKTFRCLPCHLLSSGSNVGYMLCTSSKDKLFLFSNWIAGFSCSPVSICRVFRVWLKYKCLLSEGHIFNHKFWVVSANRLFQHESCACGRDWEAWIVSSGFQTAMKMSVKTGGCFLWRTENLGVSTFICSYTILASGVFGFGWGFLFVLFGVFFRIKISLPGLLKWYLSCVQIWRSCPLIAHSQS